MNLGESCFGGMGQMSSLTMLRKSNKTTQEQLMEHSGATENKVVRVKVGESIGRRVGI